MKQIAHVHTELNKAFWFLIHDYLHVQGYLGLAEVGHSKYKGSVCPTPDEARFSAANVANINIKPVS